MGVNFFGQSTGPIKVENTWIREIYRQTPEEREGEEKIVSAKNYLSFTKDNTSVPTFMPLLAGTPVYGVIKDDDDTVIGPAAPSNAVVTVGWLVAYNNGDIPNGGSVFTPDNYATKEDLRGITTRLDSFETQISSNTTNISINTTQIKNLELSVAALSSRLNETILDVDDVTNNLNAIMADPWPDGLILVCGE